MEKSAEESLALILNDAQKSISALRQAKTGIGHLLEAHPELYAEENERGVIACIRKVLLAPVRKESSVERLLDLFGFVLALGVGGQDPDAADLNPATECLLKIVYYAEAADKGPRLQLCRLVVATMKHVDTNGDIYGIVWEGLRLAMLPRLRDKIAAIRAASALALQHLQDQENASDEVTCELGRMARSDPSKEARCAGVSSMEISEETLPSLLTAANDIAPEIRAMALKRLGEEVDPSSLSTQQRRMLVMRALKDRDEGVLGKGQWMVIRGWLKACNWEPLTLLSLVSPDNLTGSDATELVAACILDAERSPSSWGLGQPDVEALRHQLKLLVGDFSLAQGSPVTQNPSALLFLRVRAERVKKNENLSVADKEEALDYLLPDASVYASMLKSWLDEDPEQLTIEALKLVPLLDLADEAGRKALLQTLTTTLLEANEYVVETAVEALSSLHASGADYVRQVVGVITQCGSHAKPGVVEISGADDDGSAHDATTATTTGGGGGESKSSPSDSEDEDESVFWQLRLLEIIAGLLLHTTRNLESDPLLMTLEDEYLKELLASPLVRVREMTVVCLGRLALLGESVAVRYIPVWFQIASNRVEDPSVCMVALQALTDSVVVFGSCVEASMNKPTPTLADLLLSILSCGEKKGDAFRLVAAEAAAKLLFTDKLRARDGSEKEKMQAHFLLSAEHKVLAWLLVLYFEEKPVQTTGETDDNNDGGCKARLQQVLSIFFPAYVATSKQHCITLVNALRQIYTLRYSDSQSAMQLHGKVALYVASLFSRFQEEEDPESMQHGGTFIARVVLDICYELLPRGERSGDSVWRNDLCKVLGDLPAPACTPDVLKLVHLLISDRLLKQVRSWKAVTAAKAVEKFHAQCVAMDPSPETRLAEGHRALLTFALRGKSLSYDDVVAASQASQQQQQQDAQVQEACCSADVVCGICDGGEDADNILLCDGCDLGFHMKCLSPPLREVPEGDWFCGNCEAEAVMSVQVGAMVEASCKELDEVGGEEGGGTSLYLPAKVEAVNKDESTGVVTSFDLVFEKDDEEGGGGRRCVVASPHEIRAPTFVLKKRQAECQNEEDDEDDGEGLAARRENRPSRACKPASGSFRDDSSDSTAEEENHDAQQRQPQQQSAQKLHSDQKPQVEVLVDGNWECGRKDHEDSAAQHFVLEDGRSVSVPLSELKSSVQKLSARKALQVLNVGS